MGGLSTAGEAIAAAAVLKIGTGTVYIAQNTSAPTDASAGSTEDTDSGYVGAGRQVFTPGSPTAAPGSGSRYANTNAFAFGVAATNHNVTHWSLWTTATPGTGVMLAWNALPTTVALTAGNSNISVAVGGATFDFD